MSVRLSLARVPRSRALAALLATGVTFATAGCTSETPAGGPATTAAPSTTSATELSSFATVRAIADALTAAGVACTLQYEALRDEATGRKELSLCTIDGDLAQLTIWNDPGAVTKIVASAAANGDVLAYGREWTVEVKSSATARTVAEALGGLAQLP
jgi:hypothetical protein